VSNFLVTPTDELVTLCAQAGQFLESDYWQACNDNIFSDLGVSRESTSRDVKKNSRIVIVGARSVPLVTVRAVYMSAITSPKRIDVKVVSDDEELLLRRMWEEHGFSEFEEIQLYIHRFSSKEVPEPWKDAVNEADRIFVYGSDETIAEFEHYRQPWQLVIGFGSKFSIGIVTIEDLPYLDQICDDFVLYYGQGCLSPRRYFVEGTESEYLQIAGGLSKSMERYRPRLLEYWQKNEIVMQPTLLSNKITGFSELVANQEIETPMKDSLYGTMELSRADDEQIRIFLNTWRGRISTIATNSDYWRARLQDEDVKINRLCSLGYMQRPRFWWKHDSINELIYSITYLEKI
jgi:hypothetical protein